MTQHIAEPAEPGMDHAHYRFRAAPDAPPLRWPGGAQIAFLVLLHLEAWELSPPEGACKDPRFAGEFPAFDPDLRAWSQREYGNRVGIFRVLSVLDRFGVVRPSHCQRVRHGSTRRWSRNAVAAVRNSSPTAATQHA